MKMRILYNHHGCETAVKLANEFRKEMNHDILAVEEIGDDRVDLLIRWGSSKAVRRNPHNVLNTKNAVISASNKYEMFEKLKSCGVSIPSFTRSKEIAFDFQKPVLGRKNAHSKGKDIVMCLENKDVTKSTSDFWVRYIPTKEELRVYVYSGDVYCIMKKVFEDKDVYRWKTDWNTRVFTTENDDLLRKIKEEAIKSINALSLDFGAIDIIIDDNNNIKVLEVNSAPQLWGLALKGFTRRIIEYVETLSN